MSSRTSNSVRNTSVNFITQIVTIIASFVTRSVFIYALGKTFLGVSGLFSDILQLLSLAELGVGTAILYEMYRPIANNDEKKVTALMNFYGKVYTIIGCVVIVIGLAITPFLDFFVDNKSNIPHLRLIFLMYLSNTAASYFFAYKRNILIATQNGYINSLNQTAFSLLQQVIQIVILLIWKNFYAYLAVQVLCTVASNVEISRYVNKKYPYLKENKHEKLEKEDTKNIFRNVRAMMTTKISSVVVTSTDNILISKYISTAYLGIYSNYTLFVSMIRTIITKAFEGLTGSVGNLATCEDHEKSYKVYSNAYFINFWIVGFCVSMFYLLVDSFIKVWIGDSYILEWGTVALIAFNLYFRLMRNTNLVFIETYGLFRQMRVKSISEAAINLVASLFLLLALDMGIYGILLGTLISNFLTNFWWEPYVIYKDCFNKKSYRFYLRTGIYTAVFIGTIALNLFIFKYITVGSNILSFIIKLFISLIDINLIYYITLRKMDEFKEFKRIMSGFIGRMKGKLKRN